MFHNRLIRAAGLLVVCAVMVSPANTPLLAQGNRPAQGAANAAPAGPQIKSGRLTAKEVKGKIVTLKIMDIDGNSFDVRLSPQIDFSVVAPGDATLVRKGMYVTGRGVESENKVFLSKVTVHAVPKTKRMPPGRVQKVAAQEGESLNTYEVAGEIVATGPAPDYPEYTALNLKVGGRVPPVWLEPKVQVEVASGNPEHAADGAELEFITRKIGPREVPVAIRVKRTEAFTEADLFGADKAE